MRLYAGIARVFTEFARLFLVGLATDEVAVAGAAELAVSVTIALASRDKAVAAETGDWHVVMARQQIFMATELEVQFYANFAIVDECCAFIV